MTSKLFFMAYSVVLDCIRQIMQHPVCRFVWCRDGTFAT